MSPCFIWVLTSVQIQKWSQYLQTVSVWECYHIFSSGSALRQSLATNSELSSATKTLTKPFLLLDKQTTLCLPDPHWTPQPHQKKKAICWSQRLISQHNIQCCESSEMTLPDSVKVRSSFSGEGAGRACCLVTAPAIEFRWRKASCFCLCHSSLMVPLREYILCLNTCGYQFICTVAR